MKKIIFVFALICALFVFFGCASDEAPQEEPVEVVEPETTVPEEQPIPEASISENPEPVVENESADTVEPVQEEQAPEETNVVFTTEWVDLVVDDEENCGYFITTDELGSFYGIEGEFKKDAGSESSCFGFVFGYSTQEDGIVPDYFRFAINVKGEFSIHTWNAGTYKDLIDPEADTAYLYKSDALKTGYGEVNTLKIEVDSDNLFSFYINGTKVASGIEPFENSSCGVMVFFSIGTKQEENLAESPVKFSYRIIDSVTAE